MDKYPIVTPDNFKRVVNITEQLLEAVDPAKFYSPYSVVSIITQILGLNTPLMGSGDSPYSMMSLVFDLKRVSLLQEISFLSLPQRRLILDEIYEMIAPVILDETENYVELLVNTKYSQALRESGMDASEFKGMLRQKLTALKPFVQKYCTKKGGFAQIVHYGQDSDLSREYDFLERLPDDLARQWLENSFPVVNELLIRDVPDQELNTTKSIVGWVIFISNSTKQLIENGKLRKRKILQAARLAEKLGAKNIGMGGLIASFAQGGEWLSEQIPTVGFTTGHAYTIANIINILDNCVNEAGIKVRESKIAIVGAGGSIGSGCAQLVAEKSPQEIILVDLSSPVTIMKLNETQQKIKAINSTVLTSISADLSDIKKADIIICATNSPYSIIKAEFLKPGAIVIDDSFPKNISKALLKERDDVIFLEGGIMQLPYSIDIKAARNMPDLMDAPITRAFSCKEVYGCFAEVLTLGLSEHRGNYGLGYADTNLAKDIIVKAKRFELTTAPLQCFDRVVGGVKVR